MGIFLRFIEWTSQPWMESTLDSKVRIVHTATLGCDPARHN
jgi:hypothetical protein